MWCKSCQQDVPGVATADDASRVCCPRCNSTLSSGAALADFQCENSTVGADLSAADTQAELGNDAELTAGVQDKRLGPVPPSLNFDDWQFEDDACTIRHLLESLDGKRRFRFDPAHDDEDRERRLPSPHTSPSHEKKKAVTETESEFARKLLSRPKTSSGRTAWFSWALMAMGLLAFVCGAVLLGWYFLDAQEHLCRIGLPLTLGGQVALLFGLIVQLESLWQKNRGTTATLDELDQRIDELRKTTTVINNSNSSTAKSFYLHMADGAGPEVLLADLKGQLDVLAVKMASKR